MNRIYQGRVSNVEIANPDKNAEPKWLPLSDWEDALWRHHVLFQDAVNYYLVALAALADRQYAGESRIIRDLQSRVRDAWEVFPRPGKKDARSLRDSLKQWLQLRDAAKIEDTFEIILSGSEASPQARSLALSLLLDRCGGESAIQQGGRGYFPRFCDAKATPTWDYSPETLQAVDGKTRLAAILHGEATTEDLEKLAQKLDLSWTIKLQPDGRLYSAEESTARIVEAIEHTAKMIEDSAGRRFDELREVFPDRQAQFAGLKERLPDFNKVPLLPRNRKASKDLTYATILFKYFPCALTARCLSLFLKKPQTSKAADRDESPMFGGLGDDPIKLARGQRGYVFRAFTALADWKPISPGEPVWKEFDIAAFKEALKSLNQFNQKTQEREESEWDLRGRLAIMLGSALDGWKPKQSENGEADETPRPLDGEMFELARRLEREMSQELADTVLGDEQTQTFGDAAYRRREGEWRVSRAALRGFRDIAEEWNKLFEKHGDELSQDKLEEAVKAVQKDEKSRKSIGSVPLFLKLCEKAFWPLWRSESEDEEDFSKGSFLFELVKFHQTFDDWLSSQEPINLTPAEPVHSRRLYMFSDITDKLAKVSFSQEGESYLAECAIGLRRTDATFAETRVRLRYSGKRLLRDELQGGEESRWLQPMTAALGLSKPDLASGGAFDSALALMPEPPRKGSRTSAPRFLLNFPVTLDPSWIHSALGKAELWKGQFNGTRDKSLHLHWPATIKGKVGEKKKWWLDEQIIKSGFTTLSVDLGQRSAGAWALLRVTCWDPSGDTKRPVRRVGSDGERNWFAEVLSTGMLRLPGEDQQILNADGRFQQEFHGKKGRLALRDEWEEARELATALLADQPEAWIGHFAAEKSFPEQNDSLIALANRRLSRLNTFHRWSCFDPDRAEVAPRRDQLIKKLLDELAHWKDPEVAQWRLLVENEDIAAFRTAAGRGFEGLREQLGVHLEALANRAAPLRDRSWKWSKRDGDGGLYGQLADTGPQLTEKHSWIRGQRGLSLQRIEQLENLRRLFLRYNRSFDREAGKAAKFGREDRGRNSGEPCPSLLDKLDRMKEQRVNQTAHLIIAEALGVRLKPHSVSVSERVERDIHGEYEKIPGRSPVDFIVIENLDRYLTSQGRGPSENSRLMKWAHRAVRDKIKMLAEEPFGIPVLETAAAYSSRFCARTAVAGARCEERPDLDDYLRDGLKRRSEGADGPGKPRAADFTELLRQFEKLEKLNAVWRQTRSSDSRKNAKPPRTLLIPKTGGPLFVSLNGLQPVQADINAAINLGLRAVAAPEAIELLHKVRTERKDGQFVLVTRNAREKAAFAQGAGSLILKEEASAKLSKASAPNFFYDAAELARFDKGRLSLVDGSIAVASGVGLWSRVNGDFVAHLVAINRRRLQKWEDRGEEDDVSYQHPAPPPSPALV